MVDHMIESYLDGVRELERHELEQASLASVLSHVQITSEDTKKKLTKAFRKEFKARKWKTNGLIFKEVGMPCRNIPFLKGRVLTHTSWNHYNYVGSELLRFDMLSPLGSDQIDVGVYITASRALQDRYKPFFYGSISYESSLTYLKAVEHAIRVPLVIIGLLP